MFYLSKGLYGNREWKHFDFYKNQAHLWYLEVGSWTLEVTTTMESLYVTSFSYKTALVLMVIAEMLDVI